MITIDGLTKRQVALLDTMWAIDSYEDYMEWKSTQDKVEIDLLEELLLLADIDELIADGQGEDVGELLARYRG